MSNKSPVPLETLFRSCNRVTNNTFPYHFISLFLSMGIFTEPSLCRNTEHRPGIPDGIATSCREPPDPHQTANVTIPHTWTSCVMAGFPQSKCSTADLGESPGTSLLLHG
ncbi:uncharacterized protein LOC144615197 isoform X2 [Panthera onca]